MSWVDALLHVRGRKWEKKERIETSGDLDLLIRFVGNGRDWQGPFPPVSVAGEGRVCYYFCNSMIQVSKVSAFDASLQ